jgi:hypothetical protein
MVAQSRPKLAKRQLHHAENVGVNCANLGGYLKYIVVWSFVISLGCLWWLHFITESEISKLSLDVNEIRATSTNKASAPCVDTVYIHDTIYAIWWW